MKNRIGTLKEYLKRLGNGEPLEAVRKDFVEVFKDVGPAEIMKAEQEMLAEGTPLSELQKLCAAPAALFHGKTWEEHIVKTRELAQIKGHPLWFFAKENGALAMLLEQAEEKIKDGSANKKTLESLRGIAIHYAKKGDLLYPILNVRYGISGPASVMWTVDDEIRDEISFLAKMNDKESDWQERFATVVARAQEMIYKEANILFPNCAANFTEEEWIGIYHDQTDYAMCFGVEPEIWQKAEDNQYVPETSLTETEIRMPGGYLTIAQLIALLNTIPMEITFVDVNNINRFFNEGPKDFKRPGMAIDREVFSCHPPKIEATVRRIIGEFRAGALDEVPIWMDKNGKCMLVKYMAVRDKEGTYLGTLELVQDMGFAKEHFQKKEEKAELW